jgi:hypothetical protein
MGITAVISLKLLIVWTIFPIECVYAYVAITRQSFHLIYVLIYF